MWTPAAAGALQVEFESRLRRILAVDQVLTVPQVLSLSGVVFDPQALVQARDLAAHGLRPYEGQLGAFSVVELITSTVWNVPSSVVSVDMVTTWPMLARYREHRVAHLLGAAQTRIDLGAPLERWESDAAAVGETERPDAFWHLEGGGCVAIEYDSGAYSREVVRRKMAAFERFDGVVWACSSDRRRRRLRRVLGPLGYRVIQVDWWSPRRAPALEPGAGRAPLKSDLLAAGWFNLP